MTLVGKNKKAFSYQNKDVQHKNFLNKDFNKTISFQSSFTKSKFINTSFLASKFKFSTFYETIFKNCVITGTVFKKCNLKKSYFENCIIRASVFENCNMDGCSFKNCYVELEQFKAYPFLDLSSCYTEKTTQEMFSQELLDIVESLRTNDFIRRSMVLLVKNQKINLLALKKLVDNFGEEKLIELLPILPKYIKTQFYTLSFLEKILFDLESSTKI